MRKYWKPFLLSVCCLTLIPNLSFSQNEVEADSTGLPGDHFSLEGALELFKKSQSLEDFEKLLNEKDGSINNLDLNEDNEVDYIRVIDNMDGEVHAIVLQALFSAAESQDIAVIELEKTGAETAVLQIVGDEDIYGSEVITEPYSEEVDKKGGKGGPSIQRGPVYVVVNVWLWPSVRWVYRPGYVAYVSPWRWAAYPNYWRPWRPYHYRAYHARVFPHRAHYRVVTTHRVVRARPIYQPHRSTSKVVHTRTTTTVTKRGPKGGKHTATKTTSTTKVKGKRGTGTREKTTKTHTGPRGNSKTKTTTKSHGRKH
jgi:hypothetical protein